ncbi:MAG: aminotransferase class V-fold PLP-dependent enzyme [Gemmatimonadales bacterium]|nr:aminotransferase class V-fold PLP-dependent enzyme [Gemmatimonadales bacterium]MDZ4390744.1 aminotransferase class V-fold PLP-dependent enzyme [Gemmatimonadales bacterium]
MTPDWNAIGREEFAAIQGGSYCNTASIGPMPTRAVRALAECNRDRAAPVSWTMDRLSGILQRARELSARLIGADADEIALMPNTTTGLNVAARALPLQPGDVVLTFDREFPSNVYPWLARAAEGIVLERIPCTAEGWPDEARLHQRLDAPEVKAVCVSLTQFSNGYTIDLAALSRATRMSGKWLIVDAIQGCGQLPVDVRATPVDFLACGAQKWLLGPWGTGFLYVRRELITRFPPTFAGWASFQGTDDYTRLTSYDPRPWDDARRYELITLPVQDFAAMNAALELILEVGVPAIARRLQEMHAPWLRWAEQIGATITSPRGERGSGILCVKPPGDVSAVYHELAERGVVCSVREGSIRLSPCWGGGGRG